MFESTYSFFPLKPPKRLFREIIRRLNIEKRLKIFRERFWIFLAIFVGSIALAAATIFMLNSELKESESISFLFLLFSDTFEVIAYFRYFAMAVLESIPVVSIILSLAAVVLTMVSLRLAVKYRERISTLNELISSSARKAAEGKKIWN